MKFTCPGCNKTLKVADEMAGKKGKCPACKTAVTVPHKTETQAQIPVKEAYTPPPLPTPDHTFEIDQETRKKQKWHLELYGDKLTLRSLEEDTYVEIPHDQAIDKIKTAKIFIMPPLLMIKDNKKKLSFRIAPDVDEIVNDWIGKPVLLKATLKQRLGWCLPIGIIYVLGSLPLAGDPTIGLVALPFDPIGMSLGVALIILSILMKTKPQPILFLADSVWFFLLLCYTVFQILSGASIYWGIAILVHIMLIISGISHYKNFSGVKSE